MFSTIATILTVLALTFGGASATVYAAQDSLPGQALYQLKIQSEDLRFNWEHQETEQIGLALEFANRRIEELQAMLQQGQTPPESLMLRYQEHINTAFNLAAGLDDANLEPALDQIRQTLQEQDRIMAHLQDKTGTPDDAVLLQIRDQIRLRTSWTTEGLSDPSAFRLRFGGNELAPGFGPGPFITGTPTPGSSYGPGPGLQATYTCTPQAGQGPQPETGNSFGPGPQPTSAPGNSYGPGPQPTTEPGDSYGPGPQPTTKPEDGSGPGPQPTTPPADGSGPGPQPVDPGNGGGGSGSGNQP